MSRYSRLTLAEREEISRLLMAKARFHEIARILKRQTSTIAREVRRNGGPEEYRSFYAQFRAQEYAKQRKKRRKLDSPPLLAKVPGHWEGDLIVGVRNASAIGTLVERTTRYTLIVKLHAKDAASVREAFEEKFNDLPPHLKRSLTYDQGQEMAEHKEFTKNSRIAVYFAHPHSPWERGTNENTNALIRDFLPKGTDFSKVSAEKLEYIQGLLNDRPRKVLQWLSPNEVISKLLH